MFQYIYPHRERIGRFKNMTKVTYNSDLKLVLTIVLLFLIGIKTCNRTTKTIGQEFELKGGSEFELLRLIQQQCDDLNRDSCKYAKYSVDSIAKMIHDTSLKRTLNYIRNHKDEFVNSGGEYSFIFRAIDGGEGEEDYKFLYHRDPNMDGVRTSAIMEKITAQCPNGECNLGEILTELSDIADNNVGGFLEYKWWNPKTNANILKRTYVRRIEVVSQINDPLSKHKIDNIMPIYVASGFSVRETRTIYDPKTVAIALSGNIIFIGMWKLLDIDSIMNNRAVSLVIFTVINLLFIIRGLTEETKIKTEGAENEKANIINGRATAIAGMTVSMVFFSKEISSVINKDETFGNFLKLLCASFILAIVSIVNMTEHMRVENMKYGSQISMIFILNAIAMTLISVLYVFIEIVAVR